MHMSHPGVLTHAESSDRRRFSSQLQLYKASKSHDQLRHTARSVAPNHFQAQRAPSACYARAMPLAGGRELRQKCRHAGVQPGDAAAPPVRAKRGPPAQPAQPGRQCTPGLTSWTGQTLAPQARATHWRHIHSQHKEGSACGRTGEKEEPPSATGTRPEQPAQPGRMSTRELLSWRGQNLESCACLSVA